MKVFNLCNCETEISFLKGLVQDRYGFYADPVLNMDPGFELNFSTHKDVDPNLHVYTMDMSMMHNDITRTRPNSRPILCAHIWSPSMGMRRNERLKNQWLRYTFLQLDCLPYTSLPNSLDNPRPPSPSLYDSRPLAPSCSFSRSFNHFNQKTWINPIKCIKINKYLNIKS